MTAGWTYVPKGKGRRGKPCSVPLELDEEPLDAEEAKRICAEVMRIADEPHFQEYVEKVFCSGRIPKNIRCLGIGSLRSLPSKFQFALALCLDQRQRTPSESSRATVSGQEDKQQCDREGASRRHLRWYDPVMTATDVCAGELLRATLDEASRAGSYKVSSPTLFFMPHCELELYEEVLRQNTDDLHNVVVLGNSFDHYCLQKITAPSLPSAIETPLPEFTREERAFNDLYLLHFPQHHWTAWPVPASTTVGEVVSVHLKSNRLEGRAVILEEEHENRTQVRFLQDDTTANVRRQRIRGVAARPTLLLCGDTCHYRRMAATQVWIDDVVLEIGCSTGDCTEILGFHAKEIVAVDVSQAHLNDCRERKLLGPAPVEWMCADAFCLEHWLAILAKKSFTAVFIDIGGNRQGDAVFELIRMVLRDICPSLIAVKSEELQALNPRGSFLDGIHLRKPEWAKLQQKRKHRRARKLV